MNKLTGAIDKSIKRGNCRSRNVRICTARCSIFWQVIRKLAQLPEVCKKFKKAKVLKDLVQAVGRTVKLPQVLHACKTKNVSPRNAQLLWKVAPSDIQLFWKKLLRLLGLIAELEQHLLRRYYSSMDLHWLAEVEEELEEVDVVLCTAKHFKICFWAFSKPIKSPNRRLSPTPRFLVYASAWQADKRILKKAKVRAPNGSSIDKAVPQIRARANVDSVTPNSRSIEAVVETASLLFPQLEIIGDSRRTRIAIPKSSKTPRAGKHPKTMLLIFTICSVI